VISFITIKDEIRKYNNYLISDLLIFSTLILIIGNLAYFLLPDYFIIYGEGASLRFSGLFGNPNGQGIYCFLLIPINSYAIKAKMISKPVGNIILITTFISIILSGSRTALGCSILFYIYWSINNFNLYLRAFLKITLPMIAIIFASVTINIVKQNKDISQRLRFETLADAGGRLSSWKWGILQIKEHPFIGAGLKYDQTLYQTKISAFIRNNYRGMNASYSGILALILDTGIIGFIFFNIFIFYSFYQFIDRTIIVPLLITFNISITFESWIVATLNPYTILFFLQITLYQNVSTNKAKTGSNKYNFLIH